MLRLELGRSCKNGPEYLPAFHDSSPEGVMPKAFPVIDPEPHPAPSQKVTGLSRLRIMKFFENKEFPRNCQAAIIMTVIALGFRFNGARNNAFKLPERMVCYDMIEDLKGSSPRA